MSAESDGINDVVVREIPIRDFSGGTTFLQTRFWAEFKARNGWMPRAFRTAAGDILVLTRKLFSFFKIAYVPWAPFSPPDENVFSAILSGLRKKLPAAVLFIRFDLPWENALPAVRHLRKAPVDIQVPSTVIIDCSLDDDVLLAAMKPKTRYNIRLARKRGVRIERGGPGDLGQWYRLYRETAERDRISIHPFGYYRSLFNIADSSPDVKVTLFKALHESDLLGGIIVLRYGETATYLYGASSNRKRNLMASYAVQWEAVRSARSEGCGTYDLFGIPRSGDPSDPMHGLYRMKTGFGGKTVHRIGSYDFACRRLFYRIYRMLEIYRNIYHKKIKKAGRSAG